MDVKGFDMFRMFEYTGEPVKTKSGVTMFIAETDTIINEKGIEEVSVY